MNAAAVAAPFRKEVRSTVRRLFGGQRAAPKLLGILANDDPAAHKYAEWIGRAFREDELRYELVEVAETEVEDALEAANQDPDVHGILIFYPIFGAFPSFFGGNMDDYLRDSVDPRKDVEGLCHTYRRNLYRNVRYMDAAQTKKCILPCTALSVVKILEHLRVYDPRRPVGDRLQGKTITVINRSEVVGRPLAAMLANDGADVYSVDVDSIYLFRRGKLLRTAVTQEEAVRASCAVVAGVPSPSYKVPTEWIQPGTVLVNVASYKNFDEESALRIPGVKLVGMVGKVTVAMLERNVLRLYEDYAGEKAAPRKA